MDKDILFLLRVYYLQCLFLVVHSGVWRPHAEYNYYFSSSGQRWDVAKDRCENSHLASITNNDEHNFIKGLIHDGQYWIGLTPGRDGHCDCRYSGEDECTRCRDSWTWTDGTSMTFQKWAGDEPQDGEDCARFSGQNDWAGIKCNSEDASYRFICKSHLCKSKHCANGGTCSASNGRATCACKPGYTDTNCTTNFDECSSNPCHNGATCIDRINAFTCNCAPRYKGTHCDTDLCDILQCQNGTCTTKADETYCECKAGFTGTSCESVVRADNSLLADVKERDLVIALVFSIIFFVISAIALVVVVHIYIKDGKSNEPSNLDKSQIRNSISDYEYESENEL